MYDAFVHVLQLEGPLGWLIILFVAALAAFVILRFVVRLAIRVGIAIGAVLVILWLLGQVGVPVPVFG